MDREERNKSDELIRNDEARPLFVLPRPSRTLTALTTSALALPGIATPASADAPIERATASSSFSYYFEDNLSPGDFSDTTGSRQRYEVFTEQLRFDFPISKRMDLGVDFLYEEMSGASPWFVVAESGTGKPLQVMSGATIEDERIDAAVDLDFYVDSGKDTMSGGFSLERDYASFNMGLATERNFNDKNTVLNAALAFSHDWVNPTDSDGSNIRPGSDQKWSIDLFAGLSQIISRASTMQFTVNYKHSEGYLSDPYKAITDVNTSQILSDERPGSKEQVSILARYRHHFESLGGSWHGDYRFYADDWGIISHTVEMAWYQKCFEWMTIAPTLRWYTQSKADFYESILASAAAPPTRRSSDYRLSPYGALSARVKIDVELVDLFEYSPPRFLERFGVTDGFDLIASISYERYLSDGHFSVENVVESDEAPGLVNFQVVAFTLSGRF